jgi:hypothetical protein
MQNNVLAPILCWLALGASATLFIESQTGKVSLGDCNFHHPIYTPALSTEHCTFRVPLCVQRKRNLTLHLSLQQDSWQTPDPVFYTRHDTGEECTGYFQGRTSLQVNCSSNEGLLSLQVPFHDTLVLSWSQRHELFLNNRRLFASVFSRSCDGVFVLGRIKGLYLWDTILLEDALAHDCLFSPVIVPREIAGRWSINPEGMLSVKIDNEDILYCSPVGTFLHYNVFEFSACADQPTSCASLRYDFENATLTAPHPPWIYQR